MLSKEYHIDRKKILQAERDMLNTIRDDFYVELKKYEDKRKSSFLENKYTIYRSFDFCMGTELNFDMIFSRLEEHDKNLFKREQELKKQEELEIMMKGHAHVE